MRLNLSGTPWTRSTSTISTIIALLLVGSVASAHEPTSCYQVKHIEGWQVCVHRDLLPGGKERETGVPALRQLHYGLAKTTQMVADGPLEKLQRVKIWLEVDSTNGPHGRTPAYHYHPGLDWLKKMDYHPGKHKCVEFGKAAGLAKRTDFKSVQVTLHELAHAYHDQVLGFDDPDVLAAHRRAREEGKYPEGDWVVRADHKEFFAGLTTRYYESEECRKEIVERDPIFAKKLEEYWGQPKALMHDPLFDSAVATLKYTVAGQKHNRKLLVSEQLFSEFFAEQEPADANTNTSQHAEQDPAAQNALAPDAEVAAMLIQFDQKRRNILLAPELADQWTSGRVNDLLGPGGFLFDFAWEDGRLGKLTVHSKQGLPCRIRYPDFGDTALIELKETTAGESYTFDDRFGFAFHDDTKRGRLHVKDADKSVLTYNYGMQLNTGVDEKYERGCYIHPLWDVSGWQRTLTEDFPMLDDHYQHRGLGWTWPNVKVRGLDVETWHPSDPPLRQHFVKWLKREAGQDHATIAVENAWLLDDKEKVLTETVEIVMHPMRKVTRVCDERTRNRVLEINSRAIDLELTFEAVGGPLELRGGYYGGLLLRGSSEMQYEGVITTDLLGELEGDHGGNYKWADLTSRVEQFHKHRGVAIFVHPDHPPLVEDSRKPDRQLYPPGWLARTSFAGLLNPFWPGHIPLVLQPGQPVTLKYRLYVHEGDAEIGKVAEAYAEYAEYADQNE
jgi:hypothetical protein